MQTVINLQIAYYLLILMVLAYGIMLVVDSFYMKSSAYIGYKPNLKRTVSEVIFSLGDKGSDEIFQRIGISLSMRKYTAFRNLIIILMLFWSVLLFLKLNNDKALKIFVFTVGLYFTTYPTDRIGNKKTPFKIILDTLYQNRLLRRDEELMIVIVQMKNIILSCNSVSSDYILTRLLRFTNLTKPIFIQTLSLIRRGRREDAYKYFSDSFGTKLGEDFARIILILDSLPPKEFLDQLEIFQESLKENQETKVEKKSQRNKQIIWLLASAEIVIIIFNFVYIILADTMQAMSQLNF